jgi:lipopolysaccharide/colanic/teichoic acid biosynthesis glycosyltransferase/ubiquinone/menaquinone biosynthesis C-methylase UbiE
MKVRRFRIITLIADIFILALSFLVVISTKPSGLKGYLPSHSLFFITLALIWLVVSLLNGKMHRGKITGYKSLVSRVILSNITALAITALLMYSLREYSYSRLVVLGTAAIATMIELIIGAMYVSYRKATVQDSENYTQYKAFNKKNEYELVKKANGNGNGRKAARSDEINPRVIAAIAREVGKDMTGAILRMAGTRLNERTAVVSTTTVFNIANLPYENYDYIINLHKLNDIVKLNEFLDEVNARLKRGGLFLCCLETKDQRKERLLKKYPPVLNYIYYTFDFVFKRILPKLKLTRGLYNFLNKGSNMVISRAEALGRLSRAGFMIMQESFIGNYLCIEAANVFQPIPVNGVTYGPLIALPRIGKNGETIKVYKLRTMHPYSEYIQDYVYKIHDLQDGGKFKDDFRITTWGAVCRKIWLDELPMLINFFKGNMKLVGVRPLSTHYFELYSEDLQARRIRYKPGLIPPFYADMPTDIQGIQDSEKRYLDMYDKNPFLTDFKYLWKSGYNILFRKARSN